MKTKYKKDLSPLKSLALGTVISALSLLFFASIGSVLVYMLKNGSKLAPVFATGSLLISGIVSAILITKMKGSSGIFYTALSTFSLSMILFLIGLIMTKGYISIAVPLNFLLYVATSFVISFIMRGRKKKY